MRSGNEDAAFATPRLAAVADGVVLRDGELQRLTRDDSYLHELLDAGAGRKVNGGWVGRVGAARGRFAPRPA